ncbi:hypothetical protein BDA96_07G033700 [Sorghum bicolor]|uniref:Uncharacterized protein n=1 Tax=Sorghum bicolor TaxID=4558 RepID=A0A921QI97_SORBI|nr:hypothetical protein BDA96_07G033700 [Sorghum bicolor]
MTEHTAALPLPRESCLPLPCSALRCDGHGAPSAAMWQARPLFPYPARIWPHPWRAPPGGIKITRGGTTTSRRATPTPLLFPSMVQIWQVGVLWRPPEAAGHTDLATYTTCRRSRQAAACTGGCCSHGWARRARVWAQRAYPWISLFLVFLFY